MPGTAATKKKKDIIAEWLTNITTLEAITEDDFNASKPGLLAEFKNLYGKDVNLQMDGQKWVAKRFYNTDGKETVSTKDNEAQLGLEAARLQDAKDIYKEFTGFAKKTRGYIKITDFRIAAEDVSSGQKPSPASGVTENDWFDVDELD
ncbi:hypothetical protein Moror_11764 [Moniliophthora roreri MCA 2997]|uniref:Uncharacterized protein n=1 Tax=Moniliophthora roreri (strain MCA 2997) TaxID=1381753 RepID=V2WN61_MONRO|nr:hypothetical protein Moror_11764 [Moniliophthora roreri MCA 2997]